jgi:hypothetical protein
MTGRPKGDVIGKAERTSSDKKRERRQKKIRQRERQRDRDKRERAVEKLRPGLGNKYSKAQALRDLEKVTKNSNITQVQLSFMTVQIPCRVQEMYLSLLMTKLFVGPYHSSCSKLLWQPRLSIWSVCVGFVLDKGIQRQGFCGYFGFLCQFLFHQMLHSPICHLGFSQWAIYDLTKSLTLTPP